MIPLTVEAKYSIKLDRCNTLNIVILCNTQEVVILWMIYLIKYVLQIKQDLNLSVFVMITGINESKALTKHISGECKCSFDGKK